MEGVLRIGAVNCAEDPMLCHSQGVMGYPSLVIYPHVSFLVIFLVFYLLAIYYQPTYILRLGNNIIRYKYLL